VYRTLVRSVKVLVQMSEDPGINHLQCEPAVLKPVDFYVHCANISPVSQNSMLFYIHMYVCNILLIDCTESRSSHYDLTQRRR
jgi:hypothetical protein